MACVKLLDTPRCTIWQIPDLDEEPTEEMIEWLNQWSHEHWEGDECGIVVYNSVGEPHNTGCGQWIASLDGNLIPVPSKEGLDALMKGFGGDK